MSGADSRQLVDHLFRDRAGQLVAWLTRILGPAHVQLAEDVVQDALVKALQQWPFSGVPGNPGGWLFRVARNGALDVIRREASFRGRESHIAAELLRAGEAGPPHDAVLDDVLRDDELRMVLLCCHPAISPDARVALSLKTVGGFSVREIAHAFLAAEAAIAQRLARARRLLRAPGVSFDPPSGPDLAARLDSVLEVVYLLFNEGYAARDGHELIRIDLCREALRLARLLAGTPLTGTPAAHALAALVAFQSARLPARTDDEGNLVLLDDQDRALWDRRLVALGFAHLDRSAAGEAMTSYHVQAAIAAVHAGATDAASTRWDVILGLYDDLLVLNPSPLVALNRAVALARVSGPAAALESLAAIESAPPLQYYYLLPSVKGRLLAELGDREGAIAALTAALSLPCSGPERRLLARRLADIRA